MALRLDGYYLPYASASAQAGTQTAGGGAGNPRAEGGADCPAALKHSRDLIEGCECADAEAYVRETLCRL